MARDARWHRGWLFSFLAIQFILALIVLVINGVYWRKYGGTMHSQDSHSPFPGIPSFADKIKQSTTPLKCVFISIHLLNISFFFFKKKTKKQKQAIKRYAKT